MTKPGSAPYNGLYGESSLERGIYFRLQVYERAGNNSWSIWKVKKSVISVCTKAQKGLQMHFQAVIKYVDKTGFVIYLYIETCIKRTPSIKRTLAEVPKFISLIYFKWNLY